ncbi:sulfate ABC transporter permease subunit CysT [Anaerocolumna sp. AGMB13020]|uniref:sulfate ABC transporter permease subunit CysT n=1 Tax=Anaerocolumna sp. AGMB13020 TaxID=3081750 RepID=UPI002953376F|nr:sulfate ABC transporter permease subunit CysT [Anaerocolumna sp. AGMB13020]WOO37060.1 sulfate ABC transporter permease subunit CysT [Anaerocolumna sp. AGMB13020]
MKRRKRKQVIPGFGISMGVTLTLLSLVVLIPMASLVLNASTMGIHTFFDTVTDKRIVSGYVVSFSCSLIAAIINAVFGVILAWILVRYEFPFKRLIDGLIELPFALPTAVAGIALTTLYSDKGMIGKFLGAWGIKVSYSKLGIIVAMVFIGIPFVVRTIQPVLEDLDPQYEEAANVLGASRAKIFFRIVFPEIRPALLTGFGLAFARAVGEYGSVVFIAGNIPFKTEIAPLLIMSKLEQFNYDGANAIALVMLAFSFIILFAINSVQVYANKFTRE